MAASIDPDDRLRAVLVPLVERVLRTAPGQAAASHAEECPNCGTPVPSARSPYCRDACRMEAAFVRQFRAAVDDGAILIPERQTALGQALWSLQGGGYPRRQLLVPAKAVSQVIRRDGGLCAVCGSPATEIDHTDAAIASGSG